MIIIADKIVSGGNSIGKINGKTVFIPQLLPGEKAEVEIIEDKKDFSRASVTKLIEKSEHRKEPECRYYDICGGCNLQIADDDYQKEIRLGILKDSFTRSCRKYIENKPELQHIIENAEIIHDKDWNYRSRFQFHKGGLMREGSSEIISIDSCPVATEAVNRLIKEKKIDKKADKLFVFEDVQAAQTDRREKVLSETSVVIKDKTLYFDVRGFFQSNLKMLEKTLNLIESDIKQVQKRHCLLDMYSGVGTFSSFVGGLFDECVLVEHNKNALEYAGKNLDGMRFKTFAMSGEKWCSSKNASTTDFNCIIIDPPRSGMEKAVSSWLCKKKIPHVFSVSCDPVTHARDAALLIEAGYTLRKLVLLDFYPQTSHIESYAYFSI